MTSNPQSSGAQPLRPSVVGSAGPPQNFGQPMPIQFRPVVPTQQVHQFVPTASSQQFRPVGQGMPGTNIGLPSGQTQMPHFSQSTQHLPLRPGQPGHGPPSAQAIPLSYIQPNRPITPGALQPQQSVQVPNNPPPNLGGVGVPLSSSYTFATSYGQPPNSIGAPPQYLQTSQMHGPLTAAGQSWTTSGTQNVPLVTRLSQAPQQSSASAATVPVPITNPQPSPTEQTSSDWQEHTSNDGKRYYYNKKTRQSSWEKPFELMSSIEISFGFGTSGAKTTALYGHFEGGFHFSQSRGLMHQLYGRNSLPQKDENITITRSQSNPNGQFRMNSS